MFGSYQQKVKLVLIVPAYFATDQVSKVCNVYGYWVFGALFIMLNLSTEYSICTYEMAPI